MDECDRNFGRQGIKMTSMNPKRNIDTLFDEFLREMDDFSTNGTVKSLDPTSVLALVEHFISQCNTFREKMDLEDRISALLQTKFDFALAEAQVEISRNTDATIREKIRMALKKHFGEAERYAGLLINWLVVKPIKFIKTVVEPVVANTILTYSIAVHPPSLEPFDMHAMLSVQKPEVSNPSLEMDRKALDLTEIVSSTEPYSDEVLNELTNGLDGPAGDKRAPVGGAQITTKASVESTPELRPESEKLELNVERRLLYPANQVAEIPAEVVRNAEQRPIGDIQNVFANNSFKIYSCIRTTGQRSAVKSTRIGVRLVVSPKGIVKEVNLTSGGLDKTVVERVTLQLRTFRFSEISTPFGDQIVYHTFYF